MPAPGLSSNLVAKPTLAGQIEARLRRDILLGVFAPGERLNLDRLRETMEVGLSPLREAVTRIVSDGLIEVAPQRGYTVAPVSVKNFEEVCALRTELEPYALRRSIANGGLDWETSVMGALHRVNRTRRDHTDPESRAAWEAANNAFHFALIEGCDMPLLLRIHGSLISMNDRYRNLYHKAVTVQRDVVEEHTAIAEAAVQRRADEAAEILTLHIERSVKILLRLIAKTHPEEVG
jgi:DNA-binding GntR family transcriptional regulator